MSAANKSLHPRSENLQAGSAPRYVRMRGTDHQVGGDASTDGCIVVRACVIALAWLCLMAIGGAA